MNIDLVLFQFINGYAKKSRVLDFFAVFLAEYVLYILIVFLLFFAAIDNNWRMFANPMAAGVAGRFLAAESIYFLYKRKRPVEVLPISSLIKKPYHPSFPSGHASFLFAFSFALLLFNMPLAITFIAASCGISLARIFCGVHWPSDILAGVFIGAILGLLCGAFLPY